MSEHLAKSKFRKAKLKEFILKLHHDESQESVWQELLVSFWINRKE